MATQNIGLQFSDALCGFNDMLQVRGEHSKEGSHPYKQSEHRRKPARVKDLVNDTVFVTQLSFA